MKGLYLIAIAFLASWTVITTNGEEFYEDQSEEKNEEAHWEEDEYRTTTVRIPTRCPDIDPMNTTIHLAHEYDCTKFYMCLQGRKILRKCPFMDKKGNRLHFNPALQVCDWPYKAGCKHASTTHPHPTYTPTYPHPNYTTTHSYPTYTPTYPHPNYTTTHSYPTYTPTHPHPTYTTTESYPTYTPTHPHTTHTPKPPKPPPGDQCPVDNEKPIFLPHECNCTLFYECRNGWKVLRECPPDLHFSRELQACVYPEDANCKEKEPPRKCSKDSDRLPHECDCSRYYRCRRGDQILKKCPDGLHFNRKHQRCEDPESAGCKDYEPGPGPDPKPEPGDCPKDIRRKRWHHECDCRLFYKCEHKKKSLHQCPWGYYFNEKQQKCDFSSNVYECKNGWDEWAS